MTLKDEARGYAQAGMAVFPLQVGGKAPLTTRGFLDATTDLDQVEAWWTETPNANIGYAIPEGVLVVDVDPRNDGDETIAALRKKAKSLPRTLTAKTGSDGRHYFYTMPKDLRLRSTAGPGVDLKRGGKGYVVLAPSVLKVGAATAGTYEWVGDASYPMKAAPAWLLEDFARPEKDYAVIEGDFEPKPMLPFEDGTAYGVAAMEGELGRLLTTEAGGRNDALNRAAFALGQLVGGGELRGERAVERLALAAERMGLPAHEAEGTIRSGFDAGLSEPRRAPEDEPKGKSTLEAVRALREPQVAENGPFWLDWTQEFPLPEFLAYPLIPKNGYVLVYGPTQAAKSMVWLSLGAEASRRGYAVSYYSFENPPTVDADRLKRVAPSVENFRLTNEPVDFADPLQVDALIERETGRDLVILDTYSHAMNGDYQGDHNAKAIAFAKVIRYAMRETGATFVVIDHTGFGERRDDPRDSSAKRQQVDVAVLMEERTAWKGPGHPAEFRMENKKYARFSNPFELEGKVMDGDALAGDPQGRTALVLAWEPAAAATVEWRA